MPAQTQLLKEISPVLKSHATPTLATIGAFLQRKAVTWIPVDGKQGADTLRASTALNRNMSSQRDFGGNNDNDVLPQSGIRQPERATQSRQGDRITIEGINATRTNVGRDAPGVGGGIFKGEDYYSPESVPDSIASEGNVPPDSVTQASRESENH